ncbi:MAG TPA: lysylphosphatidylglycerol synthase transmembrane domain-containing protein [Vicinamibacterales bacterium]|nr:lysylphosphatidylglycerol synthase transmembrane domain-containing protein [Vicinamibacterales bacterium]
MKKTFRTVVIVVLSVGLLALFLRGANLSVVWTEMKEADSWLIGLSAAITIATMVLRAIRWQYLLAPIGHARFSAAFRTTTIGFAASAVLPARAGEVIRPYLLARQEGLSATATFATIIIERLLDAVTCVMLLASFVLFFDPGMDRAGGGLYRLVEIGGLVVGSLALLVLGGMFFAARDPQAVGRWAYKLEHLLPGRLTHALAVGLLRFAEGLAVVRTPRRLLSTLLLSFPLWLSIAAGIWVVTEAFGIDMPFTGTFLLIALLVVGVSVPTPGGVGGFEAAVQIGLTSFYGVPIDRAVGAAVVLHLVSLLPVVALGFLFLIQDGLGFGGMRNLAHAAAEGDAP